MSSTATGEAAETVADKAAQHHGKKRPASAPKPAAGKQATAESKTSTLEAGALEPASTSTTGPQPPMPENQDTADAAGMEPATDPAPDSPADDPRSLAWMSARAVSALNAVREHQAEQAKELLARMEKPPARHSTAGGEPGATAATVNTADSAAAVQAAADIVPATADSLSQPDSEAAPATAAPAYSPDTDTGISTAEAVVPGATALPQDREPAPAVDSQQHVTPPPPPPPARNRLVLRSVQLAGVLTVAGLLAFRFWPVSEDPADTAATPGAFSNTDITTLVEPPQPAAISVVTDTPAKATKVPATVSTWKPARERVKPEPETATTQAAAAKPEGRTAQADLTAATSSAVATDATAPDVNSDAQTTVQPAVPLPPATTTRPAEPVAPARTARPAARQPRYPAPGYGQYPQQPGWQQPYYRQAYPQYPAR